MSVCVGEGQGGTRKELGQHGEGELERNGAELGKDGVLGRIGDKIDDLC